MPIYRLPPFRIEQVLTTLAQTIPWSVAAYGLPDEWKRTRGEGITIGLCDTGVDLSHPDLAGQVAATEDFTGSPSGPVDMQGHGTHCAGIIAALDNDVGVVGVAPGVKLIAAKVLGDDGSGNGESVAAGIRYCRDKGANIISMSLGSPNPDPQIQDALNDVIASGCICIMAAGNDGQSGLPDSVGYPAKWQQGVAVAAVDRAGRAAPYSSVGPEVDIAAPGTDILSCFRGGSYAKLSGTSMATPFVAASIALMLAYERSNGLRLASLADVKTRLAATAKKATPTDRDPQYGWGLIQPGSLLEQIPSPVASQAFEVGPLVVNTPAKAGDLISFGFKL